MSSFLDIKVKEDHFYVKSYQKQNIQLINDTTLISLISSLFNEILDETDLIQNAIKTKFTSKSKPTIAIKDYLSRIMNFFKCSQETLILAMIYIDRVTESISHFVLNSLNIHRSVNFYKKYNINFFCRILVTSVTIAAKFFDEIYYTNAYYAKVGGLSLKELNLLEIEFLNLIDYRLYVDSDIFFQYRQKILLCNQSNSP